MARKRVFKQVFFVRHRDEPVGSGRMFRSLGYVKSHIIMTYGKKPPSYLVVDTFDLTLTDSTTANFILNPDPLCLALKEQFGNPTPSDPHACEASSSHSPSS